LAIKTICSWVGVYGSSNVIVIECHPVHEIIMIHVRLLLMGVSGQQDTTSMVRNTGYRLSSVWEDPWSNATVCNVYLFYTAWVEVHSYTPAVDMDHVSELNLDW